MRAGVPALLEQARKDGWAMEPVAREILQAYDLPVTRFAWAHSLEEALQAASALGYPLILKIVSPEVVHKSDVGGVIVGIRDEGGLKQAYQKLEKLPGFQGVLLDQTATGIELIVGAKQDPQFGTVVLVGIGGTPVEIYKDVSIRLAPLSESEAADAIASIRGKALLEGFRGSRPINRDALVNLLTRFSEAAYDLRELIESIDLNPVFCGSEIAVIADARFMLI
jgi:acetate---CoA ligase (ADP-forming) subunit beta